ncbi:MAG TPA: hypothetical protein VFI11_11295 [Anaerolineales bacterium]|nr:hypothetical protein [Anaerolineales bacterium]
MTSPDGGWVATASFEHLDRGYRVRLVVAAADGSRSWSPVDYVGHGEGYTYPSPRYWSPDSRYFYFDEHVAGGSCDFFIVQHTWRRLDVTSGEVSDYPLPEGRGHAISPDGGFLAYASAETPSQLHLRDLSSGLDQAFDLPPDLSSLPTTQAGRIMWDPTSSSLVFVTASSDFCTDVRPVFGLLTYRRLDGRLTPLLSGSQDWLFPTVWDPGGSILIQDWNGKTWWIDAATGEKVPSPSGS